jgi:hypothetical protein
MAYLSGFILKASITATRAEVNNPPCSVKSLYNFFIKSLDFKVLLGELLALDAAVNDAAEQYNLLISTVAFRVINDIRLSQNRWTKKAVADIMHASICCQGTLLKSKSSYGCFGQIEKLWNNRGADNIFLK